MQRLRQLLPLALILLILTLLTACGQRQQPPVQEPPDPRQPPAARQTPVDEPAASVAQPPGESPGAQEPTNPGASRTGPANQPEPRQGLSPVAGATAVPRAAAAQQLPQQPSPTYPQPGAQAMDPQGKTMLQQEADANAPQAAHADSVTAQSATGMSGGQRTPHHWSLPPKLPYPTNVTFMQNQRTPLADTRDDDTSTFGLDADTTSYHLALNWARDGLEVNPMSVRPEEWVNALDHRYPEPREDDRFHIRSTIIPHPLADRPEATTHLARIAIQAPRLEPADQPMNITLVLDASGSMKEGNRIEIARAAAKAITGSLDRRDTVSVVHFSQEVLDHLTVRHRRPDDRRVTDSIQDLRPTGSTNVQAGLNQGLLLAQQARSDNPRALNYLILMSDGVANVDATDPFAILDHAGAQEAQSPIRIVTLGVGISNYNDYLLEQLAQHGNGWYRYLNSPQQARQLFQDSWTDLATPFADQARAQVTWDQDAVTSWRIIGYENRLVPDRHFQQDLREFAEVPSGASVTVFYELDLDPQTRPGDRLGSLDLRWVTPMTGNRMQQDHQVNHQREASRHSQPRLRLGAIIALAADRYAALHHQDVLSHRQVGRQLQDLQGQLQDLEESLHHLDSYHDLEFLLDHLAQYAPYTPHWPKDRPEEPVISPPSGYAP